MAVNIVHAGLHKTGTTSIQLFAQDHREALRLSGVDVYQGAMIADNHVELHLASIRGERTTPYKLDTGFTADLAFVDATRQRLAAFASRSSGRARLFSNEGISFLRYADEFAALREVLPPGDIAVIIYLRNRDDFRASYRAEMLKHVRLQHVDDQSHAYVADDSWLFDFSTRVDNFRRAFGAANVTTIDYDAAVAQDGSVLPSFLDYLGCRDRFRPADWAPYFANKRA